MSPVGKMVVLLSLCTLIQTSPYDDGKYRHRTYDYYDDGKYYRPLDEGKYIPGDEGKYTYIYQKGVWPYDGTYKHLELGDNEYEIYAPRFPYVYSLIKALLNKYVSPDILNIGGDMFGATNNYFDKDRFDEEVAMTCKYLELNGTDDKNNSETVNEFYPPLLKLQEGEKIGSVYNFKGSKVLNSGSSPETKKLKLEYEVYVRVVEEEESKE